jgi:hypothetical protein
MFKIKKFSDLSNTLVVSAFPGCGKTHLFNTSDKVILDSDSSKFDKTNFPQNYIQHIEYNIGKCDIILVSSHLDVRKALSESLINYTLIYPEIELKKEYIDRYIKRGSPQSFIDLLNNNWENWINEMDNQIGCEKIKLKKGEFLSDVLT